jgi:hypothetical protein
MSDARACAVLLMRENPFSQFKHHFVLNFCLAVEPVDKVLSRIILDNAASRICLYLELFTPCGLADWYESDNRNVAVDATEFDHAAILRQVTCFPTELSLLRFPTGLCVFEAN